ncbi:GNAT family N-acetyltransferase [Brachybacterium sp. 107]|uniref:GNAT family N-acetyltransferase n=1 Tax=Brachybacterium sp. 107 TaxID=3457736 RepID=UPI0040340FD8
MSDAAVRHLPREIRTDRLLLRAVSVDDAAAQAEAVTASLPELEPWMPWAQSPQTLEQATENLAAAVGRFEAGTESTWTIWDPTGEDFIGRTSIFAVNWKVPKGEIGYWLTSTHTGRGYMREAVGAVIDAADHEGFRRLEIRCDRRNTRSARVPLSLGFELDGVFRNDAVSATDPSLLRDTLIHSRIR